MKLRRAFVALLLALSAGPALAQVQTPVERGKYLVSISGCFDCHTPGYFFGKPDMTRYLGGSDVGFKVGDLGIFVGPNLTPDKETGLGGWTDAQIEKALTTGERPDGRVITHDHAVTGPRARPCHSTCHGNPGRQP